MVINLDKPAMGKGLGLGASMFSYSITLSGLPGASLGFITALNTYDAVVLILLMAMYLIIGRNFYTVAAVVITPPFVLPVLTDIGYDPTFWGGIAVIGTPSKTSSSLNF